MKTEKLVTRQSLQQLLDHSDQVKKMVIVGRALTHLYERQTLNEQTAHSTSEDNNVGFTAFDPAFGTICARQWIDRQYLSEKQVQIWTRVMKNGFPKFVSTIGN